MTKATETSWDDIDPAAFIDDDGQAWLFLGNRKCYYARLQPNMTDLEGEIQVVPDAELGNCFTEAPWIHKHNGIHYLSFAAGFPEKTAYSVSGKITGLWVYKGLLAEGAQNSNTIHHGIVAFKGTDCLLYRDDGSLMRVTQTSDGAGKAD